MAGWQQPLNHPPMNHPLRRPWLKESVQEKRRRWREAILYQAFWQYYVQSCDFRYKLFMPKISLFAREDPSSLGRKVSKPFKVCFLFYFENSSSSSSQRQKGALRNFVNFSKDKHFVCKYFRKPFCLYFGGDNIRKWFMILAILVRWKSAQREWSV